MLELRIHSNRNKVFPVLNFVLFFLGHRVWVGEDDVVTVHLGGLVHDAQPGEVYFIKQGETHRAEGGQGGLIFLEIALGEFDEGDITRLEDKYGRT